MTSNTGMLVFSGLVLAFLATASAETGAEIGFGKCPPGYGYTCGDWCYDVEYVSQTWSVAQAECKSMNGRLASIRSEAEQTCISSIRNLTGGGDFGDAHWWIGLSSDHENVTDPNNWKWEDPTVTVGNGSFDYWAYVGDLKEPNNPDGSERCGAVVFAQNYAIRRYGESFEAWGVWNNAPCSEEKHFVCEIAKIPAGGNDTLPEAQGIWAPNYGGVSINGSDSVGNETAPPPPGMFLE